MTPFFQNLIEKLRTFSPLVGELGPDSFETFLERERLTDINETMI